MESYSLGEMLNTVMDIVLSSSFFLLTLIVGLVLLVAMILSIKSKKKFGKGLMVGVWVFLILFIVFRYNNYLYNLLDNLVNNIFMQIFFPSLAMYVIMLVITNVIMFCSILKEMPRYLKVINVIVPFVIIFLFILTLDKIVGSGLNIYEPLTIYSDSQLLILIELSMLIFVFWLLVLISIKIVRKLIKKSDDKVVAEFLDTDEDIEVLKL